MKGALGDIISVTRKSAKGITAPGDPRDGSILSIGRHGYHRVAYRDWGRLDADRTVLCVHGLTRNGHDFDPLARRLSETNRIICPDLPGRGRSDWLADPADYHLLQYNLDMTVLAARTGAERFDWIGTSMGALMGIGLAGSPNSPIRRLVVNDIAPEVPLAASQRLVQHLDQPDSFHDLGAVEAHLREAMATFGPMTDDDWKRMAHTSSYPCENGYRMAYDPGIAQNFRKFWLIIHFNLWKYWGNITCPVLILRGKDSDVLTEILLEKMLNRLPHAEAIEFEGAGHTPTLNAPAQIDPVIKWLETTVE